MGDNRLIGETADAECFDDFYRREFRSVLAVSYALAGVGNLAEDLTQEAFFAALRQWDRISRYDVPAAWVRRTAANMAVSSVRRRIAEMKALVRLGAAPVVGAPLEPEDELFWAAVRDLPKRQAQVIAFRYLEDRSIKEIAEVLACAEATVRVHLHRGRTALALRLELSLEEEE